LQGAVLARSMQHPGDVQQKSSLTQNVRPDCCGGRCCPQARRCSRVASRGTASRGGREGGHVQCAPHNDTRPRFHKLPGTFISAQQGQCHGCRAWADDLAGPGNPVRGLGPSADVTSHHRFARQPGPGGGCLLPRGGPPLTCVAVRLRSRAHAPAAILAFRIRR